jgi:hypothetical protein
VRRDSMVWADPDRSHQTMTVRTAVLLGGVLGLGLLPPQQSRVAPLP